MLTPVVHAVHNSAQEQRDLASRFRPPTASSIPTPRNPPRPPQLLIANPRLEIFPSPTKQSIGAKSNRERIAFFTDDSSCHPSAVEFRSEISNSNIRIIKNSPKCRRNSTYAFSNRNKTAHSGDLPVRFLPAATFKHENSAPRRLSATRANRLESREKWQSPLKRLGCNQSLVKIS